MRLRDVGTIESCSYPYGSEELRITFDFFIPGRWEARHREKITLQLSDGDVSCLMKHIRQAIKRRDQRLIELKRTVGEGPSEG